VLREDVAAYALAEFNRQLKEKMEGMRSHLGAARREREKLKAEISNLASVIADGRQSPALLAELEKRERRLDEINEELLASTGNGLEVKLREIEEFAMKRLRDIQGLLGGDVASRKIGTGETLHRYHAYPEREQLHGQRRLESIGRTFGWCRGPGMDRTSTRSIRVAGGGLAPNYSGRPSGYEHVIGPLILCDLCSYGKSKSSFPNLSQELL
jgi:hypothetical protein